jgi:acyl-CoA synthetase (AMP-forming)/AMP-acid ligase II
MAAEGEGRSMAAEKARRGRAAEGARERSRAPSTLAEVLAGHLAKRSKRPFLIAPETERTYTYGDLGRQTSRVERAFASRGLKPGDVIGTLLHNGWQTTATFLATMATGYVCAPFNLLAQRTQLAYVIGHSGCKLIITSSEYVVQLLEALNSAGLKVPYEVIDVDAPEWFGDTHLDAIDDAMETSPISAESPALLMYTSGTTGQPKGAVLTHGNLLSGARAVASWHGLKPSDRVLSSLPLFHINGQVIATITPFLSGGSIIAPHRFSVSNWWQLVKWHQPTWINVVPTIIAYLLNAAAPGEKYRYPSVHFGRSASAPLPADQHRAFENLFGIPIIEAMGMTESSSVVFCNPMDASRRKYGTPGLPCGVEARVIDKTGAVLGDGKTGELMLRGPNVMREYFKLPDQTHEAIAADGWLHTGDLGYRDADGFYFVTGRIKELIIKGGENIAPREIDEALLRHPAVLEAAAVGVPDRDYGQEILACVVLKAGATTDEAELRAHCVRELGSYKTPREFRFVDELPKGPSGKVQRLKLAEGYRS